MKPDLYLDILNKKRLEILKIISKGFINSNYLAGGTALALQIRHRQSYDFDLFQNKEISLQIKNKTIKSFKNHAIKTLVDTKDEFSFILDNEIKITLLNYFWRPIVPLIRNANIIPLLSIKEIALTKAFTIGRRGAYRDYFDLYVIIKNKYISMKKIIEGCEKKYGDLFSERMFLEQLSYTDDIVHDSNLVFLNEKKISIKEINKFFKREIKKL